MRRAARQVRSSCSAPPLSPVPAFSYPPLAFAPAEGGKSASLPSVKPDATEGAAGAAGGPTAEAEEQPKHSGAPHELPPLPPPFHVLPAEQHAKYWDFFRSIAHSVSCRKPGECVLRDRCAKLRERVAHAKACTLPNNQCKERCQVIRAMVHHIRNCRHHECALCGLFGQAGKRKREEAGREAAAGGASAEAAGSAEDRPAKRARDEEFRGRLELQASLYFGLSRHNIRQQLASLRSDFCPFLTAQQLRAKLQPVLRRLMEDPEGMWFNEPVDPVKAMAEVGRRCRR